MEYSPISSRFGRGEDLEDRRSDGFRFPSETTLTENTRQGGKKSTLGAAQLAVKSVECCISLSAHPRWEGASGGTGGGRELGYYGIPVLVTHHHCRGGASG